MTNSNELIEKYSRLTPLHRRAVSEFIDFLLSKNFPSSSEKKSLLLDVSVWNENDIKALLDVQRDLKAWQTPTHF